MKQWYEKMADLQEHGYDEKKLINVIHAYRMCQALIQYMTIPQTMLHK